MRTFRVYNSVFRIEKTVYSVQGIQLPFPVTYRQMAFFVGTLAVVMVLHAIPFTRWLMDATWILDSYLAKFLGLPALSAWYFTRQTLDGKAPHRFFIRYLEFKFSPHRYRRYEEVEQPRGGWQYEGSVGFRSHSHGGDAC